MILIFTLKVKNYKNEIYELTHNYDRYYIKSISGLTPPPTTINTSVGGIHDGSYYNSSRLQQRNIVITIGLRGEIEVNRQRLYSVFPLKKECTLFYKNQNRDVKIRGYVETLEADIFVYQEEVQVSIICPGTYFEGVSAIKGEIRKVQPLFEFPFSINRPIPFGNIYDRPLCVLDNIGDVECGCIFSFHFYEYTNFLRITNEVTHEYMDLKHAGFCEGDELYINTNFGDLRIILYRYDGEKMNLLPFLKNDSSWIHLEQGINKLSFSISEGHYDGLSAKVEYTPLYGGV